MKHQSLSDLFKFTDKYLDTEVCVAGWVRSIRKGKKFSFIMLNDGSSFHDLQIIFDAGKPGYEEATSQLIGAALYFKGKLVSSQGKGQGIELQAQEGKCLGESSEEYPLQKKATSLEHLREQAHLRARTKTLSSVFRVSSTLSQLTHQFFAEREFYCIHTPVITPSDCEGAGEMFRVTTLDPLKEHKNSNRDFFARAAYLSVSGQLELECFSQSLGKVYTFGPTFRSENSNTPRHLCEFWMMEPEMAFADLNEIAKLSWDYISFCVQGVLKKHSEDLSFFEQRYAPGLIQRLEDIIGRTCEEIDYSKAIEILQNAKQDFEYAPQWGSDLQTEHERYLAEQVFKGPVIVKNYPEQIKSFYMRMNDDGKTVAAMDLLVPGVGELLGGSQREERYDYLCQRMEKKGLNKTDYQWYLDLRRFGTTIHSGFGLGFERLIMYITGMSNVRDVIAFPRVSGKMY